MHILIVVNYPHTRLGTVGRALEEAGASFDLVRADLGETVPDDHAPYDGLITFGGGQNALADEQYPHLPQLAELTRAFGAADKAVLGICLGSQLVARGHGGTNIIGRPLEFGWREVRPTAAGRADPVIAALGDGAPLFHWHNDTFELPPGGVHLAESDLTRHQAVRIGRAVYAIQFHFEADTSVVADWTVDYAGLIAEQAPGWGDRFPAEAETLGRRADEVGLALARAWVAQVRPAGAVPGVMVPDAAPA